MRAMILVAGCARRMGELTKTCHKSLLMVGDKPILSWLLDALVAENINDFIFIGGYRKEDLISFVDREYPECKVSWVENPDYSTTNTAYSVLLGKGVVLMDQQDLLLINGDVVFDRRAIAITLAAEGNNVLAVRGGQVDDEEVKVTLDDAKIITEIGKHIPYETAAGESVGINRLSTSILPELFDVIKRRCDEGAGKSEFYEAAFNELVQNGAIFNIADVTDVPVMEIDTPEDYAQVNEKVLPRLLAGD